MKRDRFITLLAILVVAITFVPKISLAGAVSPSVATAITNDVKLQGASLIIKVRRGGPRVRRAQRRRPGGHRPNYNRPHAQRKWRGRRWGRRIGGIIVGTAIVAAIAGQVPPRPADGLCWAWTDGARTRGYWYDC